MTCTASPGRGRRLRRGPPRRAPPPRAARRRRAARGGGARRGGPRRSLLPRPGLAVHVIATAGHVDHGKSMLVRALTGMEPDRWEAERRRGMTIDLGFAWMTLPSGEEMAFVDVPGHERFITNMLAGAGPRSEEHTSELQSRRDLVCRL